jgi:hypothetical protein
MNRRVLRFIIVAAGAALAIAFAFRQWQEAKRMAAASEQRRILRIDMQRQLSAAEESLHEARLQAADLDRELKTAGAQAGPAAGADPQSESARAGATAALHARYMKAYRDNLGVQWGLLFRLLGLSQDQTEKLKDLLVQREENDITVQQAANRRGLDESSPEIQALDDELDRENKAAIAALLGPQGYAQFRDYYHDRAILPIVSDLAGELYSTDNPLSAPQAQQLIGILAGSSDKKNGSTVVKGTLNWDEAIAGAQASLSQPQVEALAALRSQYDTDQQLTAFTKNLIESAAAPGP